MRTDGHRRSEQFEDRGQGSGRRGGGAAAGIVGLLLRRFGWKGALLGIVALGGVYFLAPDGVKQAVFGGMVAGGGGSGASACEASPENAAACDFSRVVLASTEDVWRAHFQAGNLPSYGTGARGEYPLPTLVVFTGSVETGGCGGATSDAGPFYCPADRKLYIDPTFYQVMAQQLRAPGDFAQAYVIAHEVGHHVQNVIGAMRVRMPGESDEQVSVRVELQADCLAGVWGHTARSTLHIDEADLGEALGAAHAIGDDTLGHRDPRAFTHGSSAQRVRWFRRGFDSGDARQCDTFAVRDHAQL
jgi:predicted metalloprotease